MNDPDYVVVTWHDAFDDATVWTPIADIGTEPRVIVSAGILVHHTDDAVVLALSWDADALTVGHVIHIPIAVVQDVQRLTVTIESEED